MHFRWQTIFSLPPEIEPKLPPPYRFWFLVILFQKFTHTSIWKPHFSPKKRILLVKFTPHLNFLSYSRYELGNKFYFKHLGVTLNILACSLVIASYFSGIIVGHGCSLNTFEADSCKNSHSSPHSMLCNFCSLSPRIIPLFPNGEGV